ncbi:MAG: HAMP domain-containing histidine kinase [Phycisphaerae bacterium]|nr:HAMP domain-containing histidine kinase [Phycisphaerae bacterium]NIX32568.1 GAF domain-containing protein [Phycisphaerae bacterium]
MSKDVDAPDQGQRPGSDLEETNEKKIADLETRIAYLERVAEVSQILNSTLELGPLLEIITQVSTELTKTEACSILLYEEESGELRFMPSTFAKGEGIALSIETSIAGLVFKRVKPVLIRDVKADPRWNRQVDQVSDFDTRSILGVPLKIKNQVIGVMELVNKRAENGFTQEDIQIATTLAAQAAVAIENARLVKDTQQAYEELAELDRLKNEFVSIASHELRTPLAVILGYASFLRDRVGKEESEQLEIVLSSAMKLRNLIDDMMNLRHVQSNDLQLQLTIFSMLELVTEVLLEFQTLIVAKSLRVKVELHEGDDDPVNIEADRQKIYLIVANLISNAIKFTSESGFILVSLGRRDGYIYLRIADTGIGIPKKQHEKIFEDFYQVERSLTRRFEGIGLGLPIVKGMVEIHKGKITVESVEGRGSQFTVMLPVSQELA